MKKFAIGCGIVALVLIVVIGAGGFYVYSRYVRPMTGTITQFAQVGELEKQVRNTSSFAAPAGNELSEEMVNRFVKVQEAMEARLGPRMAELKTKYDEIDRAMKSEGRKASFAEVMGAMKDLSGLLVDAKRVQVQALNQGDFSVKEYEWVRQHVFAAVGVVAAGFDVKDLQKAARDVGTRDEGSTEPAIGEVPDRNRQLVAPYQEKLKEWAALAYFGL